MSKCTGGRATLLSAWLVVAAVAACGAAPQPAATPDVAAADGVVVASLDGGGETTVPDALAPADDTAPDTAVAPADIVADTSVAAPDQAVAPAETAVADVVADTVGADSEGASAADATPEVVEGLPCKPGAQTCQGPKLKTCLPKGDGFSISNCYPGMTCLNSTCVPVESNLIIAFDSSGSMNDAVKGPDGKNKCETGYTTWPGCEYADPKFATGCTRMGVSKYVFKQALAKIDEQLVRMALFRFPQKITGSGTSCSSGFYSGDSKITGDTDITGISEAGAESGWFWNNLNQIMCVPFPPNPAIAIKDAITLWMDGKEDKGPPANPELRPTGGTPIGKTLFYLGEYIRNKVIIDGKPCTSDASCGNVNYGCKANKCVDPNRSCRETVVVLFTDGGEANSNTYFAPWVQAKRLSTGLGCQVNGDCAPGATCQTIQKCKSTVGSTIDCQADTDCAVGQKCTPATLCLPKESITGWQCSAGMAACLPDATAGQQAYCPPPAVCVQDPRPILTASAKINGALSADNSLKSFDGKPFSVKVIVVDISGATDVKAIAGSASIAIAGGGKLLGADASDPGALLSSLDAAFDIKTKKICGVEQ